ncbi:NADH dehydrogenase [ubiquinone] 1 subunit C2 [Cryptotermes secundus]|uniref:NADH dehydrogenase [ubiquinone] 1 subunit C2 n=1 Tax=Cryptotermes secundus TaxID=105785 RepID=UPI000CD7B7F6|nr:NADH dehydrogenase [ubiquinone] 1 subunit C2 [Cryptotermes secundus]
MAGKSNMELLLRDEDRIDPFLSKWWNPVAASVVGVITVVFVRHAQRRPLISGIQTHILTGIGCFLAGYHIDQYRNQYLAERDAVLRNYLERHPEDFPEPERKKFSEILQPWIPIR